MKTLINATLFVVKGPKGPYYAICDQDSGAVFTESTEQAAVTRANEMDMILVDRQEVGHAEMLKLTSERPIGSSFETEHATVEGIA
jgi:hypothetical protein